MTPMTLQDFAEIVAIETNRNNPAFIHITVKSPTVNSEQAEPKKSPSRQAIQERCMMTVLDQKSKLPKICMKAAADKGAFIGYLTEKKDSIGGVCSSHKSKSLKFGTVQEVKAIPGVKLPKTSAPANLASIVDKAVEKIHGTKDSLVEKIKGDVMLDAPKKRGPKKSTTTSDPTKAIDFNAVQVSVADHAKDESVSEKSELLKAEPATTKKITKRAIIQKAE